MAKSKHRRGQAPKKKPVADWRERVDKLIASFKRARTTLAKNEKELRRFVDQDSPSFQAWLEAEFGKEQAQIRQLEEEIDATHGRIFALDEEWPFSDDVDGADIEDFMAAAMFRAIMGDVRGIDIDKLTPEACNEAFDEFKGAMDCFHEGDRAGFQQKMMHMARDESRENRQAVKAIYRNLCKCLHPDRNPDITKVEKELWTDLQEAYEALDLTAMQEVECRWKLETGQPLDPRDEPRLTVLVGSYRARNQFIQADLREAKQDPAWGFSSREDLTVLAEEMAADLKMIIRKLKMELKALRLEESQMTGEPVITPKPRPKPAKAKQPPSETVGREQYEFAF